MKMIRGRRETVEEVDSNYTEEEVDM